MSPRLPTLLAAAGVTGLGLLAHRWGLSARHVRRHVPAVPAPPTLPQDPPDRPPSQRLRDGCGPLFHRVYRIDFVAPGNTPEELMTDLKRELNAYSPAELASFERRVEQRPGEIVTGDEFVVHIRGPWNGPVRVVEQGPTTMGLVTLDGHMEAGQIWFSVGPAPPEVTAKRPGALRFKIESWARSRDETVDLAYNRLGLAMLAQQAVWAFMCRRVVSQAGGRPLGPVCVLTEEAPFDANARTDYTADA